jgi:hypothetical protein
MSGSDKMRVAEVRITIEQIADQYMDPLPPVIATRDADFKWTIEGGGLYPRHVQMLAQIDRAVLEADR